jgi:hypothetical protein
MTPRSDAPAKRPRDPRLDVFRGLGMFIILFAHIPWNTWADWIPARFGFSDATETFVFCSGVASSLAFARVYEERGWALGTARILHRIWQVYWAHVAVFVAVVALLAMADRAIPGASYVRTGLNLGLFLDDPAGKLLGLLTLTYVPNFFDILPMYLVILAMVPLVMAAAARDVRLAGVLCGGLWLLAALGLLDLPAEMDPGGRVWFFNPFSWQALFFLGFAFGRGWIPAPRADGRLMAASLAVIVAAAPFSCHYGFACHGGWGAFPWLGEVHTSLGFLIDKTHLGPFRIVHFLATAYVANSLAGEGGRRLTGPLASAVAQVGRQTLAVFLAGLVLAQGLGVALDLIGHGAPQQAVINIAGCAALVLVARAVEWFKSGPWGRAARLTPRPAEAPDTSTPPRHDAVVVPTR